MSLFILDALRKSEHERQRQGGPGLAEVSRSPLRRRRPASGPRRPWRCWSRIYSAAWAVPTPRRGCWQEGVEGGSRFAPVAEKLLGAQPARTHEHSRLERSRACVAKTTPVPATPAPLKREPTGKRSPRPLAADATVPGGGMRNPLEHSEMAGGTIPADPALAERGASVPIGPPAVTEYGTRPGWVTYEALPGSGATAAEAGSKLARRSTTSRCRAACRRCASTCMCTRPIRRSGSSSSIN